ncbi:MAG: nickel pincer cofactor biosynthesis protein LarB [Candidatus Odinarchaeum yellowstonii]|uniref:Nickel pincer cofactor biosynthesis protein LarB n=1 Tax=Odinarchaeota yellowstonii (strain LCB_4) TaxID=1841599 RepID=A0AAF0D2F1_ODILC|nr:MAG: nickel pincer cofactor biosynthesis protein LarB [Candidatus Odinarchaeum yellowstonii]
MNIKDILERYKRGQISLEEAEKLLKADAVEKIGEVAVIDVNRSVRKGVAEIILAEGKATSDLIEIIRVLDSKGRDIIISRLNKEQFEAVKSIIPEEKLILNEKARMIIVVNNKVRSSERKPTVGLITAGSSDIPVAEECRMILEYMNCTVISAYDVGVAGIHRLFPYIKKMIEADVACIVVAAGMEGALASVVAGLVDVPVIGVPVSTGYGEGGKGKAALYSMLQSCSTGLLVVNIDNGISAGICAALIAKKTVK